MTAPCNVVTDEEKREREARSVALEKAYVHDVYDQLSHHFSEERYRPWPRVRQFLEQLEPGSLVCDAGCGNGKYLSVNPAVFKVGSDRCASLVDVARRKDHEVLICDALNLPYRDESFDAALSVAVIHHLATRDRRVRVLRELARILRVGGRILITVWAKEQRHRKFESQDILVPWRTPDRSSSEEKPSNEHDVASTTTSDEDVTHYHAYTQTSESDSCSCKKVQSNENGEQADQCSVCSASVEGDGCDNNVTRRRQRNRHHKGRSVDPHRPSCSSQSSSDLSSPSETCYSFVKGFRKALQKLASTRRASGAYQRTYQRWFTDSSDCLNQMGQCPVTVQVDHSCELPIELRHLDPDDDGGAGVGPEGCSSRPASPSERSRSSPPSLGGKRSSVQSTDLDRIVTSDGTPFPRPFSTSSLAASAQNNRSRSLSDLLHSLPVSVSSWLRNRLSEGELVAQTPAQDASSMCRSQSSVSWFVPAKFTCQKATAGVCNDLATSGSADRGESPCGLQRREEEPESSGGRQPQPPTATAAVQTDKKMSEELPVRRRPLLIKQKRTFHIFESYCEEEDSSACVATDDAGESLPAPVKPQTTDRRRAGQVRKQGSMNDYLLSCDRLDERENLKRSFPRQTSLGDDKVLACRRSPVKSVKNEAAPPPLPQPPLVQPADKDKESRTDPPVSEVKDFSSLRNGLVRMWQSIRGDPKVPAAVPAGGNVLQRAAAKHFPSLLETHNAAVYRVLSKEDIRSPSRLPSAGQDFNFAFAKCCAEQDLDDRVRPASHRLSYRDEGSDSSKDSSLQSDTSVDSEDSCISVIYVPRPDQVKAEPTEAGKVRNSSSSSSDGSERSPKVKVFPVLVLPVTDEVAEAVADQTLMAASASPPPDVAAANRNPCLSSQSTPSADVKCETKPQCQPLSCLIEDDETGESTSVPVDGAANAPVPLAGKKAPPSLTGSPLTFKRQVPRFLSFEVFNPETDDVDSDSSSVSSSDSAGSVISVGDPMWPAFQDRRQTILNSSQLSSLDLPGKNDYQSLEVDPPPTPPVRPDDDSSSCPPGASEAVISQPAPVSSEFEPDVKWSTAALVADDCSAGSESVTLEEDNDITGSWVRNCPLQGLSRLDECHEDVDDLEMDKDQFENETAVPERRCSSHQWKDKAKSSFSASTSSIDSSFSAPSFSSARQSSSASAVSELRKNSDDSAMISTLPLIRSRNLADRAAARARVTKANSVSEDELNRLPVGHCSNLPLTKLIDRSVEDSSSVSTSQDSLPSDTGGTMTLHRYYHVFREGELDQLIERYVENLHIISSYYDHANWCIVAEKVHVWTI